MAKTLPKPPKPYQQFVKQFPEVARAYEAFGKSVRQAGSLSHREVALVKLAISVGARMEGSTHAHARKALAQGITADALLHTAVLAAPTIGFPNMMAALGWVRETVK